MAEAKTRTTEHKEAATKVAAKKPAAKAKAVPPKKDYVLFISAEEEIQQFDINVMGNRITPFWDVDHEHLIWRVPADQADRFAAHEFVVKGRILRED